MTYTPYTTQAVIGWDNVFTAGTLTASGEASDGAAENAVDGLTYDWWETEGDTGGDTLQVQLGSPQACDYLAIAAHDLGTEGASITLQGSADGSAWNTVAGPYSPTTDAPWLWRFASASYLYWRVVILGGPVRLGVLNAGAAMVLPEGIFVGHAPAPLNRKPRLLNNESDRGQFLGRSVIRAGAEVTVSQERVSQAYARAVWRPFADFAETRPFFFAWRHDERPTEVFYGWSTEGASIEQGSNGFMRVSIEMRGQVE